MVSNKLNSEEFMCGNKRAYKSTISYESSTEYYKIKLNLIDKKTNLVIVPSVFPVESHSCFF